MLPLVLVFKSTIGQSFVLVIEIVVFPIPEAHAISASFTIIDTVLAVVDGLSEPDL